MAGIYIHIPFCRQLCGYCDFYSSMSLARKGEMLEALAYELEMRKDYLVSEPVTTLYFGGGTPSVYSPEELQSVADRVKGLFSVEKFEEVTLEANPDDLTADYLRRLARTDIGRLSIGVQSFHDHHLRFFNRRHDGKAAFDSVREAQRQGFSNITIDLIYGFLGLGEEEWQYNIDKFVELDIPHLSAYHLTIEPKTVLGKKAAKGEFAAVSEDVSEKHYDILENRMREAGYEHYEISNFARPGNQAIHNGNYWNGTRYLGVGPSAHSYDGTGRSWNVQSNSLYLKNLYSGDDFFERETLKGNDIWNEYLLTRLRTSKGISLQETGTLFGDGRLRYLISGARRFLDNGTLIRENDRIRIPTPKFLLSDNIISELFFTEQE